MNDEHVVGQAKAWVRIDCIVHMNLLDVADRFDCLEMHENGTNAVLVQAQRCLIEWIAPCTALDAIHARVIEQIG